MVEFVNTPPVSAAPPNTTNPGDEYHDGAVACELLTSELLPKEMLPYLEENFGTAPSLLSNRAICTNYFKEMNNMRVVCENWHTASMMLKKYGKDICDDLLELQLDLLTVYSDFENMLKTGTCESVNQNTVENLVTKMLVRFNDMNDIVKRRSSKKARTLQRNASDVNTNFNNSTPEQSPEPSATHSSASGSASSASGSASSASSAESRWRISLADSPSVSGHRVVTDVD